MKISVARGLGLACGLLFVFQRSLIYLPPRGAPAVGEGLLLHYRVVLPGVGHNSISARGEYWEALRRGV